jgi:hypothetical protein
MQQDPGPIVYFDTDDIDASIGKVRSLGGKSEDKQAIPGRDHLSEAAGIWPVASTGARWLAILAP